MENLLYEKDGGYFIRGEHQEPGSEEGRSELTKWQYEQLTAIPTTVSGDIGEANILRLHQESDPASPLFKGSVAANGAEPDGDGPVEVETQPGYYEKSSGNSPAEVSPETTGTSVHTTEAATAANAGITSQEVVAEVEAKQAEPEADLPQAPNPPADESNTQS